MGLTIEVYYWQSNFDPLKCRERPAGDQILLCGSKVRQIDAPKKLRLVNVVGNPVIQTQIGVFQP